MFRLWKLVLEKKDGQGRVKNILRRALGDSEPQQEQKRKQTLVKPSRFGLKDFKADDRMFVTDPSVNAELRRRKDRPSQPNRNKDPDTELATVQPKKSFKVGKMEAANERLRDDFDDRSADDLKDTWPKEFLPPHFIKNK